MIYRHIGLCLSCNEVMSPDFTVRVAYACRCRKTILTIHQSLKTVTLSGRGVFLYQIKILEVGI